MPDIVHVLVGCGGSGIKTLRRLNELLSQDYYWRKRMPKEIYYVIVDTNAVEMEEFETGVREDLRGVPAHPFITTIHLSEGETYLQPLVDKFLVKPFVNGENIEGRDRLLEHWWHQQPDKPFIAPKVTGLTEGAGQCPPVSYFLTWMHLPQFEQKFQELIEEIRDRNQGFGPRDEINFLIVSGLAGGTGRGSWELIAFKLREQFGKSLKSPNPLAFLFDSSVFRDVMLEYPEQRVAMKANSLTGFSQLACWVKNRIAGHDDRTVSIPYRLPSMATPENPATDVLQMRIEENIQYAAPVNHAYLVFGENEVAQLARSQEYFEMVGAGIYAALSKSSIGRTKINSTEPLVGLAAGMCEVDSVGLRRYFEAQARCQAVYMMTEPHAQHVSKAVGEFFKQTGLRIDVTDDDPDTFYSADSRGLLIQKALAELDNALSGPFERFVDALTRDHVEDTRNAVRNLMQPNDDAVQTAFNKTLAGANLNPAATAETLAKELFNTTHSIAAVRSFIEQVRIGLEEELVEMPTEILSLGKYPPEELVEQFATRPIPFFSRFFDEGEQKKLKEAVRRALPRVNYIEIRGQLEKRYKQWSEELVRLEQNATDTLHCLQRLETRFVRVRDRVIQTADNAFKSLFTNPDSPEEALDEQFSASLFYRRRLKPVLRKGDDLKLLKATEVTLEQELFDVCFEGLLQKRDFSESEAFDVRTRLGKKIQAAIERTVGISDNFITDHFSIRKVVAGLTVAWHTFLRRPHNFDNRNFFEGRFAEIFGFVPQRDTESDEIEYNFPKIDEFILQMAGSLANTCKPYWKLREGRGRAFKVDLFVPTELDETVAKEIAQRHIKNSDITLNVHREAQTSDPGATSANPFIILAYSTQGTDDFESIDSLKYFSESELINLMKATEVESGDTIFKNYPGVRNGGIGYTDPFYVRNTKASGLRWKPWYSEDAQRLVANNETVDALLYALFPGDVNGRAELSKLNDSLVGIGWVAPLFHAKGLNRYDFSRLPLLYRDKKVVADQQLQDLSGWDINSPVASNAGLHNVFEVLKGDQGLTPLRDRILQESHVFWNEVLPSFNVQTGLPAHRAVLDEYTAWLGSMSRSCTPEDREIWNQLLARVEKMGA